MTIVRPRVSVGMPVYNGEQYMGKAIDSILAQTFGDFELIISDNTSTDRTQEICQEYVARDQRVRYHRNAKNLGAAPNFNHVFKMATAPYFKWACADDMCAPKFLERCVDVLDREPAVILAYPRTTMIDGDDNFTDYYADNLDLRDPRPSQRFGTFLVRQPGYSNAMHGLIRTDYLAKTSLLGSYGTSDRNLLGELTLYGQFAEVPEYDYIKRNHARASMKITNANDHNLAVFADTRNTGKIMFPKWRRMYEYLKAIQRAPISLTEKSLCYGHLSRFLIDPQKVGWLVRDIRAGMGQMIQRVQRH